MKPRRLLLLLLSVTCGLSVTQAFPVVTSRFTISDGLSDNSALCVMRDSYGLVWVGTENGLNYYDGMRIHAYRDLVTRLNPNETNTVMSLYEHDGNIWLGGTSGVYVFNRREYESHRFDRRTRYGVTVSTAVSKMFETDGRLLWMLTQGQGIFIYDMQADELTQDSRHGNFFCDAVVGPDGLVYAVTLSGQLVVFRGDGSYLRHYDVASYRQDKNPISLACTSDALWLGYNTQLLLLDGNNLELQADLPALGSIRSLLSDRQGRLLIGSDNGVFRYDRQTRQLEHITQETDGHAMLTDNTVNRLAWDIDSTLMVLTRAGGVCLIPMSERGFTFVPLPKESPERNVVRAMCRGAKDELWIGTDRGIYHGNYEKRLVTRYANGRLPYETTSLVMDGNDLWIGTRHDGIRVLDTATGNITAYTCSPNTPYSLPSNEVNSLYRTGKGDIYVLTNWGLNRFAPSNGYFYGYANVSAMTSFVCMQESASGWLWASSSNRGLYRMQPGGNSFDRFTSETIGQQTVTVMHSDRQGDLWAATNCGGLYRFNTRQGDFERYDEEGSLLHGQSIAFIEEDEQGALWLGTSVGIIIHIINICN